MRRNWKLTAAAAGALLMGASGAAAAATGDRPDAAAAVTAVSVIPGPGRADVVLSIDGDARISDFTLEGPHRIVVDVEGAVMDLRAPRYDRVSRAGILNVRLAQYRADVVRLVLDLDAAREYTISRSGGSLSVSVVGPDAFAPWSAGVSAVVADAPPSTGAMSEDSRFEPVRSAGPVRPVAMYEAPQATQEPRINVSFANTDIKTVIATFAAFSGRTFVIGSTVSGQVTAEIPGQPWDIALYKILQTNGFAAQEDSTGIITIDSYQNISARVAAEPLVTQLVPVNYAKASEMALAISQLMATCSSASAGAQVVDLEADTGLNTGGAAPVGAAAPQPQTCGRGSVGVDDATNTLIVTESVSRLPEIVGYIRDLDVRTPQVAIKAKIISVDRTGAEELGLSYDLGNRNGCFNRLLTCVDPVSGNPVEGEIVLFGGDAFFGVANANRQFGTTGALNLIYNVVMGEYRLTAFLDALSSQQLSDVQAEPSTTTMDNKTATLFAGTQLAYLLTPPPVPGQISQAAATIAQQEIGITLTVTPHVTANRQVSMEIEAVQQSLVAITQAGPTINERRANNQVLVGDGESAVIAGLTQTQVTKTRSGLPLLMNIPYIGRLFSQTRTEERKQDLIILVTPHIIDEGEVVRSVRPQ